MRRNQDMLVFRDAVGPVEKVEHTAHVAQNLLIGRKQSVVGINLGRFFIEIPRADKAVVPDIAFFVLAVDDANFAVHFHIRKAENQMNAFLLEHFGILYVACFVETGPQFDLHRYVFSVFGRIDERIGDLRIFGQAVNGDFDVFDPRVQGRFAQKFNHIFIIMIRSIQQPVFFLDLLQNTAA